MSEELSSFSLHVSHPYWGPGIFPVWYKQIPGGSSALEAFAAEISISLCCNHCFSRNCTAHFRVVSYGSSEQPVLPRSIYSSPLTQPGLKLAGDHEDPHKPEQPLLTRWICCWDSRAGFYVCHRVSVITSLQKPSRVSQTIPALQQGRGFLSSQGFSGKILSPGMLWEEWTRTGFKEDFVVLRSRHHQHH